MSSLADDLRRLAGVPRLLVALDFDGTLAPIVDEPGAARALPEAREALAGLAALPGTRVAFISGRSIESLLHVSEAADDVLLVGSHGVEARLDEPGVRLTLSEGELTSLDRLGRELARIAGDDLRVETKPVGFALHTRGAAPARAEEAQREARERLDGLGLTVRSGKDVLEFSVRAATKGDAVDLLRSHARADAVLFAGDDVTDEDGFAALRPGDVGVKVGEGASRAAHRVADPAAIAGLLGDLFRERSGNSPAGDS